jgi:hypothetical protein
MSDLGEILNIANVNVLDEAAAVRYFYIFTID